MTDDDRNSGTVRGSVPELRLPIPALKRLLKVRRINGAMNESGELWEPDGWMVAFLDAGPRIDQLAIDICGLASEVYPVSRKASRAGPTRWKSRKTVPAHRYPTRGDMSRRLAQDKSSPTWNRRRAISAF